VAPCTSLRVHSSSAEAAQVLLQRVASQACLEEGIAVNFHPFAKLVSLGAWDNREEATEDATH